MISFPSAELEAQDTSSTGLIHPSTYLIGRLKSWYWSKKLRQHLHRPRSHGIMTDPQHMSCTSMQLLQQERLGAQEGYLARGFADRKTC